MMSSKNYSDEGFLNSTLAYFDTKDFEANSAPIIHSEFNVTHCWYVLLVILCCSINFAILTHFSKCTLSFL